MLAADCLDITERHGQMFVFMLMFSLVSLPLETCGACRLRSIKLCWCQCSSGTLCKCHSGERVVAGEASGQTPPAYRCSPVIGWGFEVSGQRQNYPHYRFQITINYVCEKKENVCTFSNDLDIHRKFGINTRKRAKKTFRDSPLADMCGMRMCLEEMNCKTCATFCLLSSLFCGATWTPSSSSPADSVKEIWERDFKLFFF